jgi:hypothetical protein
MPLPPPPPEALISSGKPIASAKWTASSASVTGPSEPGTTGMPAACKALRPAILSPINAICSGAGPMKVKPCSSTMVANSAFSARNPSPGWIASASAIVAAVRMAALLR